MFHIIEHGILSDDFVNDLILSVSGTSLHPLLRVLWTNIVMYFSYRYPLTSYIRGHLLYCEMTVLCLSNDIKYVVIQKEIKDWSSHNPIDYLDPWYTLLNPTLILFLLSSTHHAFASLLFTTCMPLTVFPSATHMLSSNIQICEFH